jgi:fibronectin type 3 domain-containing protein
VVGYHVFRSTDPNLPKDQWRRLTRSPVDRTTFNDDAVEPGVRYYYYVTAIDAAGNTSRPSEVASDQIQRLP